MWKVPLVDDPIRGLRVGVSEDAEDWEPCAPDVDPVAWDDGNPGEPPVRTDRDCAMAGWCDQDEIPPRTCRDSETAERCDQNEALVQTHENGSVVAQWCDRNGWIREPQGYGV